MASCKYMEYKSEEKYFPRLYCSIDGKQCIFSKRCEKEQKFIPNAELWVDCPKRISENIKDIPQGSYYIQTKRYNKKGFLILYVVIDDHTESITTTLTEINQNYIYIKESIDSYEVSLVPFQEKKCRKTKK